MKIVQQQAVFNQLNGRYNREQAETGCDHDFDRVAILVEKVNTFDQRR